MKRRTGRNDVVRPVIELIEERLCMRSDRMIQMIAALVLAACIAMAGALMPKINASASEAQLRYTDEAIEGAPMPVVIAQSVGVLRGIMVNYLWIRAENLKEEGKFFEAYHLAKWITDLQPRFASVWSFQAWNMAYNISVATHTRDERWHWVQSGIRLLREKGIKYNPNDMGLYKELSWIFFHKVGGYTDDAHNYYKQQMADRWQGILGELPYGHEERMAMLAEIARAPERIEELEAQIPAVTSLVTELDGVGYDLNESLLRAVERLEAAQTSFLGEQMNLFERLTNEGQLETLDEQTREGLAPLVALRKLRENEDYAEAWPALLTHVRKRVLIDDYNMEPEYMRLFTERFGPLDWRVAAAHTVYWAALGVERGKTRYTQEGFDQINTDRMLFHALQDLKRKGRVYYDFATKDHSFGPDLRFVPFYLEVGELVMQRNPFLNRGGETYADGMRNFLIDAVREYYSAGQYQEAQEVYDRLAKEFAQEGKPDRFNHSLEEFVLREAYDRFDSPDVARPLVFNYIMSAYVNGLAHGNQEAYENNLKIARRIYDNFHKQYADYYGQIDIVEQRIVMPEWGELMTMAFIQAMTDQSVTIEERVALWNAPAVDPLRVRTYDLITPQLRPTFESRFGAILSFDELFPAPAGLEAWRAQRRQTDEGVTELNVERK